MRIPSLQLQWDRDGGITAIDSGAVLTFPDGFFQFRDRGSDNRISEKNFTMRTATMLHLVLQFHVDRSCFHGEEAGAKKGGKVE